MRVAADGNLARALADRPPPVGEVDPGARRELHAVQNEVREPGEPQVAVEPLRSPEDGLVHPLHRVPKLLLRFLPLRGEP